MLELYRLYFRVPYEEDEHEWVYLGLPSELQVLRHTEDSGLGLISHEVQGLLRQAKSQCQSGSAVCGVGYWELEKIVCDEIGEGNED